MFILLKAGRLTRSHWKQILIFIPFLLGISWALVSLEQLGTAPQLLIILALVLIPFILFLYWIKPHVIINLFIFAIPLLVGQEIVLGLNAGELATLLMMSLGIITLLGPQEKLAEGYRQLRPLIWPLVGLALMGLISMQVNGTTSQLEVVRMVFKPLSFALFILLIMVHYDTHQKIQGLIKALLLGGFAVATYSIIAYVMGWNSDPEYYYSEYGLSRIGGTFEHVNQLGGYMVLISFPTLIYAFSAKHSWVKIFFLITFIAEIFALLLSVTLGSILSLLISGLLAAMYIFRLNVMRIIGLGILIILTFLSAWLMNPLLAYRLDIIGNRLYGRLANYSAGLHLAFDHLWFGLGSQDRMLEAITASYSYTPFGETNSVPHNAFLYTWVEKGIFALILFFILIINSLKLLLRQHFLSHQHLLLQGILVGVAGFLVQNMSNNLLLHARIGFIFFAFLVVAMKLPLCREGEKQ
jgi:O-antigen ligase